MHFKKKSWRLYSYSLAILHFSLTWQLWSHCRNWKTIDSVLCTRKRSFSARFVKQRQFTCRSVFVFSLPIFIKKRHQTRCAVLRQQCRHYWTGRKTKDVFTMTVFHVNLFLKIPTFRFIGSCTSLIGSEDFWEPLI